MKNIPFDKEPVQIKHWSDDENFVAELDERVKRWEDGTEPGFSVNEVKAYLNEQRKERQKIKANATVNNN
jgi:hypothetical protein